MPATTSSAIPDRTQRHLTLIGDLVRQGRWRIARRTSFLSLIGDARLDLSQAQLTSRETVITVGGLINDLKIVVPHNIDVEVGGFTLIGDRKVATSTTTYEGAPVLRIRLITLIGDVRVERP